MSENVVSIVLVNWNQKDDLRKCLAAIDQMSFKDFNVLLVDNNSKDGSVEEVRGIHLRDFWILRARKNEGYARANNIGVRFARRKGCKYILLLNTDALIERNAVENMVNFLEQHGDIAAISPLILFYRDRETISYAGGVIDSFRQFRHRGSYEKFAAQYSYPVQTDFLTGCCLLIRSDALKNGRLFDEKYFMYFEDTDLSLRLKESGRKVFFFPHARVWHKVSDTKDLERRFYYNYYLNRNRLLLVKQHRPQVLTHVFIETIFRAGKSLLRLRFKKGFAIARALVDFSRERFGML